ncbi:MAG: GH36 C-terminal domain-containing protein [Acidobacteriaceae bacterium]
MARARSVEQHDAARAALALYKAKLRPLIRHADLYHVAPRPDGVHWDGIQYFDPASQRGVLFAFHGSASETTEREHLFVLQGLRPENSYRLHFEDHSSADKTFSGRELMRKGIRVLLPAPNSSELIFLHKLLPPGALSPP